MNKSTQQLIALVGGVLLFISLFSLCNPFKREVMLLEDPHVDHFVQLEAASAVDMLWVVDNSGSMQSSQENLARNFSSFIQAFVGEGQELIDFQMAVITTDPDEDIRGAFVEGDVLTRSQAMADRDSFIRRFEHLVQVGTSGSGNECGLWAATSSWQRPEHQGFFRPEGMLVINMLTDEADKSMRERQQSVIDFVDSCRSFKAGRRVMINTIVDTVGYRKLRSLVQANQLYSTLQSHKGRIDRTGVDLVAPAYLTQGRILDIKRDFAQSLASLGQDISTLAQSFALTRKADSDLRMMVFVDGEEIDPYYWIYNSTLNAIQFTDEFIPVPAARIEVHYEVFHEYGSYPGEGDGYEEGY